MPSNQPDDDTQRSSLIERSAQRIQETIDEHRANLEGQVEDLLDRMMQEEDGGTRPLYWGWGLELDEEGTPTIKTYGNLREKFEQLAEGFEEPFIDWHVDPDEDAVEITADLPDVSAEDVTVHVDDRTVTIEAEGPDRLQKASATLPVDLVPDTAEAWFEEGKLGIRIQREPRVTVDAVEVPVEESSTRHTKL